MYTYFSSSSASTGTVKTLNFSWEIIEAWPFVSEINFSPGWPKLIRTITTVAPDEVVLVLGTISETKPLNGLSG